jgi:hypothetical protein
MTETEFEATLLAAPIGGAVTYWIGDLAFEVGKNGDVRTLHVAVRAAYLAGRVSLTQQRRPEGSFDYIARKRQPRTIGDVLRKHEARVAAS